MGEMSLPGGQVHPVRRRGMSDPGATGRFGEYGGRYVPESLVPACAEVEAA